MGNIFKYVDEQGVEHVLNMTETVIDDSVGTATSSRRTYSGAKIEEKLSGLNTSLSQSISNLSQTVANNKSTIESALATEITNRENAITSAIATEVTDRNNAISSAVSAEATARENAISSAIATEVTNRNSAISTALLDYMKNAQPLPANTDLDTFNTEGVYYASEDVVSTITGKPTVLDVVGSRISFCFIIMPTSVTAERTRRVKILIAFSANSLTYESIFVKGQGNWYSLTTSMSISRVTAGRATKVEGFDFYTVDEFNPVTISNVGTFEIDNYGSQDLPGQDMHPVYLKFTPSVFTEPNLNWEYRFVKNTYVNVGDEGSNQCYCYLKETTPWIAGDAWRTRTGVNLITGGAPLCAEFLDRGEVFKNMTKRETIDSYSEMHYPLGVFFRRNAVMQPVVQIRLVNTGYTSGTY